MSYGAFFTIPFPIHTHFNHYFNVPTTHPSAVHTLRINKHFQCLSTHLVTSPALPWHGPSGRSPPNYTTSWASVSGANAGHTWRF